MARRNVTRRKQRGGDKEETKALLQSLKNKNEASLSRNEKQLLNKAREINRLSNTLNSKLNTKQKFLKRHTLNNAAKRYGVRTARNMMRAYEGSNLQKKLAAANGTIAKLEYLIDELKKE